jgi:hypothetical protein
MPEGGDRRWYIEPVQVAEVDEPDAAGPCETTGWT